MKKSRIMKKRLFIFLILLMGFGFAVVSSQLNINGKANIKNIKPWDIYFDNFQLTSGSVEAQNLNISNDKTRIDYDIVLDLPGQFYEFTIDVVNDGRKEAIIDSLDVVGVSQELEGIIISDVTYVDGSVIASHDRIKGKKRKTYKVLVKYSDDIPYDSILDSEVHLNLSLTVIYTVSDVKDNEDVTNFTKLVKYDAKNDRGLNFQNSVDKYDVKNGLGLYVLAGTEEDVHPIYYYRGYVNNNNALFAGYCWKIVRTTDAGGTKLIYNGLPDTMYANPEKISGSDYLHVTNDEKNPYTYNAERNVWISPNIREVATSSISFSLKSGSYYLMYQNYSSTGNFEGKIYLDDEELETMDLENTGIIELSDISATSVVRVEYAKYYPYTNYSDDYFEFSIVTDLGESSFGCGKKSGQEAQIGTSMFNSDSNSPAYSGYMLNTMGYYYMGYISLNSSYIYGSSVSYSGGTYTLEDTSSTADLQHRYTCLNNTGTCTSLRYIYYKQPGSSYAYAVQLVNGKTINNAITRDINNENNSSSSIKTYVDSWFKETFKNYFTNLGKDYNNYLEDSVWCNDRTVSNLGGWDPNSDTMEEYLTYGAYARRTSGNPSLTCSNKLDAFTVSDLVNGNGKLTYPIGLLTNDEIMLAGNRGYLYTGNSYWTMSPYMVSPYSVEILTANGSYSPNSTAGVRPSVVVKKDVKVRDGGDGTSVRPYEFIVQ